MSVLADQRPQEFSSNNEGEKVMNGSSRLDIWRAVKSRLPKGSQLRLLVSTGSDGL